MTIFDYNSSEPKLRHATVIFVVYIQWTGLTDNRILQGLVLAIHYSSFYTGDHFSNAFL